MQTVCLLTEKAQVKIRRQTVSSRLSQWGQSDDMDAFAFTQIGDELSAAGPRLLVLWSTQPLFPDANETPLREACTVFVVELPAETSR